MMRMTVARRKFFPGMSLAAMVIFLAGCGQGDSPISERSPTAPTLESQAAIQFNLGDGGDGNGASSTSALPAGGESPAAASGINAPLTGEILEISQLVPRHGATLTVGRFTYRILPNSLSQPTTVTLRDLTGVAGRVECEVLPADLTLSKHSHLTSFFSDLMPVAGCTMFEVSNSGTPSEAWLQLGGSQSGGGLKANVYDVGHFAPGTSQ